MEHIIFFVIYLFRKMCDKLLATTIKLQIVKYMKYQMIFNILFQDFV